jgi:hypothetical protein
MMTLYSHHTNVTKGVAEAFVAGTGPETLADDLLQLLYFDYPQQVCVCVWVSVCHS